MSDYKFSTLCEFLLVLAVIVAVTILVRGCCNDAKADPIPPQTLEVLQGWHTGRYALVDYAQSTKPDGVFLTVIVCDAEPECKANIAKRIPEGVRVLNSIEPTDERFLFYKATLDEWRLYVLE